MTGAFTRWPSWRRYADDFVGEVLRPEWQVENEDTKRYGVVEGNYLLLISNNSELNRIVESIDGIGDFTIELLGHGTFSLARGFMREWERQACLAVGVRFSKDDRINISACTERTYLSKTVGGEWNGFTHEHDRFNRFLLRLEKKGVQYAGTAVLDGNEIELGHVEVRGAHGVAGGEALDRHGHAVDHLETRRSRISAGGPWAISSPSRP